MIEENDKIDTKGSYEAPAFEVTDLEEAIGVSYGSGANDL